MNIKFAFPISVACLVFIIKGLFNFFLYDLVIVLLFCVILCNCCLCIVSYFCGCNPMHEYKYDYSSEPIPSLSRLFSSTLGLNHRCSVGMWLLSS